MSVSPVIFQKNERPKLKLTVCRVLSRCNDFDENLTGTRLRYIYEAKAEPGFGNKGSSLFGGSHFLRASNMNFWVWELYPGGY